MPANLPPIRSVEVISLRAVDAPHVNEYMQAADGICGITISGEAAQRIASLWRRLPFGEQRRCHTPTYGLRFRSEAGVVCQASVCWKCNNVFGEAGGEPLSLTFDGSAPVARMLLAEIQRGVGDAPGFE